MATSSAWMTSPIKGRIYTSLNPATAVPGAMTHLLIVWGALVLTIVVLMVAIGLFLKRKDVRA